MAHDIETNGSEAAFVSAHTHAWHQLGTVLPDAFTAEEAMKHGHLGGWNVRKQPLWTRASEDAEPMVVPNRQAVVRDNPFNPGQQDVLGTVGDAYHIIQNEEHAGFLNDLVDESGAVFDTAGSLNGGRRTFLTMKLPGHINVGGIDPVENHIAALNSHDGSMAFTIMITPIRVVCANTMNMAFRNHSHIYRVRHTSGAGRNLTEVRKALDLTFDYLDAFQVEANQLLETELTLSKFEQLVNREFGVSDDAPAATITRTENKIEQMTSLFADAQTQENVRGTAWAGLNALTEWADHYAPTRGDDRDMVRARNAVLQTTFKNRALELMKTV